MKYRYICNNCGHRFSSNYEDDCCPVCYDNDVEILKANQATINKEEENDSSYPYQKHLRVNQQYRPRKH